MAKIEKVQNVRTNEIGYRVKYGTASFGGRRVAIVDTREFARDIDVSSDVGKHVIVRGASLGDCYADWKVIG